MLKVLALPFSWRELAARTVNDGRGDRLLGLAAQLAFYFLLALVPAIAFLVALTSFAPPGIIDRMMQSAGTVMPPEMLAVLDTQMEAIRGRQHGGVLSLGLLMALWGSSAAMVSAGEALNFAYDIEEARPWWKVRLNAILMTSMLAVFVLGAFTLVVAGPELGATVAGSLGLGAVFTTVWNIVQWPVAFALVVVGVALVYYLGPDADQDWSLVTPGAVAATLLWLVASLALRFYVTNFGHYNATYGSLGGVIVLMLWFYLSGLAILVGAELNAAIERASPYALHAGAKVPGERRKIGARARRAWEASRQTGGTESRL